MESQDNSFDQELRQMFQNYNNNTRQQHLHPRTIDAQHHYPNHSNQGQFTHVKHHSQMGSDIHNDKSTRSGSNGVTTNFESLERKQCLTSAKTTTALTRYQSQIHVNHKNAQEGKNGFVSLQMKKQSFQQSREEAQSKKSSDSNNNIMDNYATSSSRRFTTKLKSSIHHVLSSQHQSIQNKTSSTSGHARDYQKSNTHSLSSNRDRQNTHSNGQRSKRSGTRKQLVTLDFSSQHLHRIPSQQEIINLMALKQSQKNAPLELILDNNSIQSIVKSYAHFPPSMRILRIKNNQMTYLGSLGMDIAPRLKVLDLSNNRLISLEFVKQAGRLIQLNISHNYIQDEQLGFLSGLSKLKILDISGNQLKDSVVITRLLTCFLDLRSLNLAQNQLSKTFKIDTALVKLRELFLQENRISIFIITQEMQSLRTLNLAQNKLQIFKGLDKNCNDSLEYLDIQMNEITYLSGLKDNYNSIYGMHLLRTLNANSNQIKEILLNNEEDSIQLAYLSELLIRDNKLKSYKFLNNIATVRLNLLDLGMNQIWRVEPIYDNLKTLEILLLDKNQIDNLMNLGYYVNLKQLVLDNNNINYSFNNLQHLFNLKHLEDLRINLIDTQQNNIQQLNQFVAELPNLKYLDGQDLDRLLLNQSQFKTKSMLIPKNLQQTNQIKAQNTMELTLSNQGNFQEIRHLDLEDSKEQKEIFNEVIRISHRQSLSHSHGEDFQSKNHPGSSSRSGGLITHKSSDQNLIQSKSNDQILTLDQYRTETNLYSNQTKNFNTDYENMPFTRQNDQKSYINLLNIDRKLQLDKDNYQNGFHHQSQPLIHQKYQQPSNNQMHVKPQILEIKGLETTVKEGTYQIYSGEMQMMLNTDSSNSKYQKIDMDYLKETRCTPKINTATLNTHQPIMTTANKHQYTSATSIINTEYSQQPTLQLTKNTQNTTDKMHQMLKTIQIDKIQSDIYQIAHQLIKQTNFKDNEDAKLFEKVSEAILEKVKQTLEIVKQKIQYNYSTPKHNVGIIVEERTNIIQQQQEPNVNNTLDLTQYNSNSSVALVNRSNTELLTVLRSQLSELVNALHLSYKRQSILTTVNSTKSAVQNTSAPQISRLLKDICQHGFGLPNVSSFQLGKYLFQRKDEIHMLEKEIMMNNNPDALLKSQIFQDVLNNEILEQIYSKNIDIGQMRDKMKQYVLQLSKDNEQIYSLDSLEEQHQVQPALKENQRYNNQTQIPQDSIININEISEIKPSQNFEIDKNEISSIAYLKRVKNMRQKSCNQNKENQQISTTIVQASQSQFNTVNILQSESENQQNIQPRSASQQHQHQKFFNKIALPEIDQDKSSVQFENSSQKQFLTQNQSQTPLNVRSNLNINNPNIITAKQNFKNQKYQKALLQLCNYSKHPLHQITQQQSTLTFITELHLTKSQDKGQSLQFEGKLIKYLLKSCLIAKARKIYKAYNYEKILRLENMLLQQQQTQTKSEIMFALVPKHLAKEVFEKQNNQLVDNLLLSTNVSSIITSKQQISSSYLMVFLTVFTNVYEENNQNRRLHEEVVKQMGKDCIIKGPQQDLVLCLEPSKCLAVYLIEMSPR